MLLVFSAGLTAGLAMLVLSLATLYKPELEFWPPPDAQSWQHPTFRWLFRVFFVALVVLSGLEVDHGPIWRWLVGVPLLILGFGLALYWTNFLGWRNAFGEALGLKTSGAYRWSRNPIYVVSIIGMVGWAIVIDSWWVTALLLLWASFYFVAPLLEEPWMQQQYGDEYQAYRSRVHRYIGWVSGGNSDRMNDGKPEAMTRSERDRPARR